MKRKQETYLIKLSQIKLLEVNAYDFLEALETAKKIMKNNEDYNKFEIVDVYKKEWAK